MSDPYSVLRVTQGHGQDRYAYPEASQHMYTRSVAGDHSETAGVPFPTNAQRASIQKRFQDTISAWEEKNGAAAEEHGAMTELPPRQPPTLLAALQRPDLTDEARRKIVRSLRPKQPLEKKWKFIVDSNIRDNPEHTSTNDYTVTFNTDLLGTRVHGFELIGYNIQRAEWTIEPTETGIPFRWGWVGVPGSRAIGLRSDTVDKEAQPEGTFSFTGTTTLTVELPLVRNPVVRIDTFEDEGTKVVRLWFARRVGTCPWTIDGLTLDHVGHPTIGSYPGRFALTAASVETVYQSSYVSTTPSFPAAVTPEDILSNAEVWDSSTASTPDLYTLRIVDPDFTQYFSTDTEVRATSTPLGYLYALPPKSAVDLGAQMSGQANDLIARRREADSTTTILPLQSARLEWSSNTRRFRLNVSWDYSPLFPAMDVRGYYASLVQQGFARDSALMTIMPVRPAVSDGLSDRMGLPGCVPSGITNLTETGGSWEAEGRARMYAVDTVDATPVPSGSDSAFWSSLNTTASSMQFRAQDSTKTAWRIPFRVPNGMTTDVVYAEISNGEYRPWGLAVAITEAIEANAQLRPYRIVATPVFLQFAGNAIAGFRFESRATPMPLSFHLAFDLFDGTSSTNQILNPAKLGYLPISYAGRTVYDPSELSVMGDPFLGFSVPIAFPATELGTGVSAPLPSVPHIVNSYSGQRVQITQLAYDPAQVSHIANVDHELRGPVTLTTSQARLFYQLQPVNIEVVVPADSILFSSVSGAVESSGGGITGDIFVGSGEELSGSGAGTFVDPLSIFGGPSVYSDGADGGFVDPLSLFGQSTVRDRAGAGVTADSIVGIFKSVHEPLSLSNEGIAKDMVSLLGSGARAYGTAEIGPEGGTSGPYRQHVVQVGGNLARVDTLLDNLANKQRVRLSFLELIQLLLTIFKQYGGGISVTGGGGAEALHNVISSYNDAVKPPDFSKEFLVDLANTYAWRFATISTNDITIDGDGTITGATNILANQLYRATLDVSGEASCSIKEGTAEIGQRIAADTILFKPTGTVETLTLNIDGTEVDVPVTRFEMSFSAPDYSIAYTGLDPITSLFTGETYWVDLTDVSDTFNSTSITTMPGTSAFEFADNNAWVRFRVAHNVPHVTFSETDIAAVDKPATTVAKMYMIANNYAMSVPAHVLLDHAGTNRYPFSISDALSDLGITYTTDAEAVEKLVDALDPGSTANRRVLVVPGSSETGQWASDMGVSPTSFEPVDTQTMFYAALDMVSDVPEASVSVARLLEHPFSIDFASRVPRMMRPELLGFQEGEYAVGVGASIASVIDIHRSGPPFLLLSVELNGSSTPAPRTMRPDGLDVAFLEGTDVERSIAHTSSTNGTVLALSNADANSAATSTRTTMTASAYIVLSDATTLLDRSSDRSPTLFPTGQLLGKIRVRLLRPDGTLYSTHGRRTVVMLQFISLAENPNFLSDGGSS